MKNLLTREEFGEVCLKRENHKCAICPEYENLSVHHIFERKLWSDGGYYKSNGIAVCPNCHIQVEAGFILPHKLFELIGVEKDDILYPDGMDDNYVYDKWGQRLIWWDDEKEIFIVIPNQYQGKFEKAVKYAGGMIRAVNGKWLKDYMEIDCVENDAIAIYIAKGSRIVMESNNGLY